jgi:arginine decarboxylase
MNQDLDEEEFRSHYDASQYRSECWGELKRVTHRIERTAVRGGEAEPHRRRALELLDTLAELERYWCFPGPKEVDAVRRLVQRGSRKTLHNHVTRLLRAMVSESYRSYDPSQDEWEEDQEDVDTEPRTLPRNETRPYFEVLLVDDLTSEEAADVRRKLIGMRREDDPFVYDVVVVDNAEDAVIAVQFNHNVQACVLRYAFPAETDASRTELRYYLDHPGVADLRHTTERGRSPLLGSLLKSLRPELDLFLNTDEPMEHIAGQVDSDFRRVFYSQENYLELHLSILKGISERYETPFFTALKKYSQKPTGVFHALPISRGQSITRSHWIQDMGRFYGTNIFLAETSSTTGGLDSLLQPYGPLKQAQNLAARAFGARKTWFVTNGTSCANKIVMQALVRPDDIVLVSHDCHKSHHYALVLAGANPIYLDPYPLHPYTMYGAVSINEIKRALLELRAAGKLDRVRMVLLTNCTFDGVVYHPERVMRELLAIKPDLIFVWDEAWFAFARFSPVYRERTAMAAANKLRTMLRSNTYRERYAAWKTRFEARVAKDGDQAWLEEELLPDPDDARLRVYATQSTHKTLTALRQGSMIHAHDQDFERLSQDAFREAYMTYTSTSPNYQILASLDVGRRQVELEGYQFVKRSIELAMVLRERIYEHPLLSRYFRVLSVVDLIPLPYRKSGFHRFYDVDSGFQPMGEAWRHDEFTIDPTRVTVFIGGTGIEGDSFKKLLMDEHDIQVNKTSRNTVLFMLNIGTSRGSVAYLLKVLVQIAQDLDERREHQSSLDERMHLQRIESLTEKLPPLPNFSRFHPAFVPPGLVGTRAGDLRRAYFLAYEQQNTEFVPIGQALAERIEAGEEVVSASFVTPYPPGFPILVPGQIVSAEILAYLQALDVKEIHGYSHDHGLRVFCNAALAQAAADSRAGIADLVEEDDRHPEIAPGKTGTDPAAGPRHRAAQDSST